MDLYPAIQMFLAESRELLEQMEDALLRLEADPHDRDLLDAIFRAAHTIKGSAGVFGYDPVVHFTHGVESVLDRLRDGEFALTPTLSALLLRCGDHMGALVEACTASETPPTELISVSETLAAELAAATGDTQADETAARSPAEAETTAGPARWRIELEFGSEVLRNGMDPLSFLRYLETLGTVRDVRTSIARLPRWSDLDPEACALDVELLFEGDVPLATIDGVFDFVRDDCAIRITPAEHPDAETLAAIADYPAQAPRLGEILVGSQAVSDDTLRAALAAQSAQAEAGAPPRPLGEILVAEGATSPAVVEAALERQGQIKQQKGQESRLIRVDADKLDQLITLVGELVIAGSGINAKAQRAGLADIVESAETLARLVEGVRDSALGLRMVQIGPTFQRFQRVVRDVSRELGKDIELEITGGDTELDKSVVERIGDPLMHLVRNAMDHGIETPAARAAAGKPARARLRLHACHDSGSIVIDVADDGAGLNTEKIRAKAIERGLLAAGATPSEHEIHQMIFAAGFSTADAVSNLSGRGVGMDVVRSNIEALRGTIELESRAGLGTRVRIRLPLTLAIIDGFLVGLGNARYVLPLDVVEECLELSPAERLAVGKQGFLNVRGEPLPMLRLREVFQLGEADWRRENVVVVRFGALKAGIVVDELLGELQTVIKPLGKLFAFLPGISGSTILGTGEVALILDVPGLVKRADPPRGQSLATAQSALS
ncbi:MAG: chemotaxis protein CheA [Gammaproteobacteria bacterium]|nr:chemotaxis protein CheA [Gammaproteobacteria bacterium]